MKPEKLNFIWKHSDIEQCKLVKIIAPLGQMGQMEMKCISNTEKYFYIGQGYSGERCGPWASCLLFNIFTVVCSISFNITVLPHPLVCHNRRLNGTVLCMRLKKKNSEALCYRRLGKIKIPPCSKALCTEHRPKFCSPSPVMVMTPYN